MSAQGSPEPSSSAPSLPPGFQTVAAILNTPNDKLKAGTMTFNVIGFIKDYRPPYKTRGTDFKCTIEIKDYSTHGSEGLKVIMFWPEDRMPKIQGVSDVVLIRNARAQMYSGEVSLLASYATEVHVMPASKIPPTLPRDSRAPWQSTPQLTCRHPTPVETSYVVWANSQVSELNLPSNEEFEMKSMQAMNVKDKYSLLKDVKPECFYDILGEVMRKYDGSSGSTLYISDYTAHSRFYNYEWGGGETVEPRDGDEFGYIKTRPKKNNDWPGPYGKMSIQLTLFDAHAEFVRENVEAGQWVLLKNVYINFGRMGDCLEGFLRGDPNSSEKVRVRILKRSEDKDDIRWKEALTRKLQWNQKFEKQKQDILDKAAGLEGKRKLDDKEHSKKNSKLRRQARRAAAEGKAANFEAKVAKKFDLNENIRCSYPDQPILPLHVILRRPTILLGTEAPREAVSPFDVGKYRANVRVVGYFPDKVEDFSVGRRISDYDILSDYSGGEDTDVEEDRRVFKSGNGFAKKWEWRFALEVEDADPKSPKERMWLLVDNHNAQGLLGIDATNLRGDRTALRQVKEQLCILWGDLEEQRSAFLRQQGADDTKSLPPSSLDPDSSAPEPRRKVGDQPNLDSDDENEVPHQRSPDRDTSAKQEQEFSSSTTKAGLPASIPAVKNKPFTCCIRQYGIKIDEEDPSKANAGDGKRWKRMFGLFGTRIV